jgi:hypothetical protein
VNIAQGAVEAVDPIEELIGTTPRLPSKVAMGGDGKPSSTHWLVPPSKNRAALTTRGRSAARFHGRKSQWAREQSDRLTGGARYYFAVTAQDTANHESGFSNEVFKDIP